MGVTSKKSRYTYLYVRPSVRLLLLLAPDPSLSLRGRCSRRRFLVRIHVSGCFPRVVPHLAREAIAVIDSFADNAGAVLPGATLLRYLVFRNCALIQIRNRWQSHAVSVVPNARTAERIRVGDAWQIAVARWGRAGRSFGYFFPVDRRRRRRYRRWRRWRGDRRGWRRRLSGWVGRKRRWRRRRRRRRRGRGRAGRLEGRRRTLQNNRHTALRCIPRPWIWRAAVAHLRESATAVEVDLLRLWRVARGPHVLLPTDIDGANT
mmetsp:Transcript_26469/g.77670  ORF Transcript_26469/g.77670 Transcript_26469/m.77670 type:complete len:262 (-) Transcript_26469:496-1281(-)